MDAAHDEGSPNLHDCATVHAFPPNKFVENIAVRRNGNLLLTVHNTNELLTLNPNAKNTGPTVLATFDQGVCGIVECGEDAFFVSSGTIGKPGSWAIYKVLLGQQTTGGVTVSKLADVPEALFLNGSALLDYSAGRILAADSLLGTIFEVNVFSASVSVWLHHDLLCKVTDIPGYPGVNGIKVHRGYLYCSNTDAKTVVRAAMNGQGSATGHVEVVYERINVDDFAFDSAGSLYATTHVFNSVAKLRANGQRQRIAGSLDDPTLAGTTAAAFGRTPGDRTALYVTTNGGMSSPVGGNVAPSRVMKIEVGFTEDSQSRPARILFVATSHDQLNNGTKTGVWLEEAAEPYAVLKEHKVEIVVASPRGGQVPIDPRSNPTDQQRIFWEKAMEALRSSIPLQGLKAEDFDGVFLPGGHGPMFDLASDAELASLLRQFHNQGKPIGAVCHGPAGLANVKLDNNEYLVNGKEVTSYSWEEETLAQLDKDVPFNLESVLAAHGAIYSAGAPRSSYVVEDGLLVTGQNPASSKDTAHSFFRVLQAYKTGQYLYSATTPKYAIYCHMKETAEAERAAQELRPKHYEFLAKSQNQIVFGGPLVSDQNKPSAMLIVVNAQTKEEAAAFIAKEPYNSSGLVFASVTIHRWRQVIPGRLELEMAIFK